MRVSAYVGYLLMIFLLFWGLNYYRIPLETTLNLPQDARLQAVLEQSAKEINKVREELKHPSDRCLASTNDLARYDKEIHELLSDVMNKMGIPTPGFIKSKGKNFVDRNLKQRVMGMWGPFTGEITVVEKLPPGLMPWVMAHERAHYFGIAKESEASFLAHLAVMNAKDPLIRYSGHLAFEMQFQEFRDPGSTKLSKGVLKDLACIDGFWSGYGPQSKISQKAYDVYLVINGIESGLANYDEALDLYARYRTKQITRDKHPQE